MKNATPKIEISFYREIHIKRATFETLLEVFDPLEMTPQGIAAHCDSLQLRFYGYKGEKSLPFMIPELRNLMRQLRSKWPYAPFFCDLNSGYVTFEAFASLDNLTVIDWDNSDQLGFRIPTLQLRHYVAQSHRIIRALGAKARMKRNDIKARLDRFDCYLEQGCGKWKA